MAAVPASLAWDSVWGVRGVSGGPARTHTVLVERAGVQEVGCLAQRRLVLREPAERLGLGLVQPAWGPPPLAALQAPRQQVSLSSAPTTGLGEVEP